MCRRGVGMGRGEFGLGLDFGKGYDEDGKMRLSRYFEWMVNLWTV